MTVEKEYSINFTEQQLKFCCLILHCNEMNSYIFVNGDEMYKFKPKDSGINGALSCLGKVPNHFSVYNMKMTEFYGYVYYFSVDYDGIDVDILDTIKYLMQKHDIKYLD